jgi:hypothetical protein
MQPDKLILLYVVQDSVDEFEKIYPGTFQTLRVGVTFTGVMFSALDSNL